MSVKLADTLAPLGSFEVAKAEDISVEIDGTTKMLQTAIDNGEIGGGDSSFTGTQAEWESLLASEKAKYTTVYFTDDDENEIPHNAIDICPTIRFSEIGAWKNTYDLTIQGTFSKGNLLYQYLVPSDGDIGHFEIFNFETGQRVGKTDDIKCYHGNDFAVVGNDVYCAPFCTYNEGQVRINKIIKFTIGSSTTTEIDAFNGLTSNCLYGITTYDNDTLICALRGDGNSVDSTVFYKYHITSGEIEEVETDWGDYYYSINSFPHPIFYSNGYIYLTASFDTGIYKIKLFNTKCKVVSYNALPNKNNYNFPLGELEGICQIDKYGKNYFVLTYGSVYNTIMFEGLCINGIGTNSLISDTTISDVQWHTYRLDYSKPDTFFEDGSENYPFKMFERCMYATQTPSILTTGKPNTMLVPGVIEEGRAIEVSSVNIGIGTYSSDYTVTFKDTICFTRSKVYSSTNWVFDGIAQFGSLSITKVLGSMTFNGEFVKSDTAIITTSATQFQGAMDLLYTRNAESVGELTVDVDLSKYKYYAVKCAFSGNATNGYIPLFMGKVGENISLSSVYGGKLCWKLVTSTQSSVTFGATKVYSEYGNTNSAVDDIWSMIPIAVFGIR